MPRSEFSYRILSAIIKKVKKEKAGNGVSAIYEKGDREAVLICYNTLETFREDVVKAAAKTLSKEYKTATPVHREKESWVSCVTKDGEKPFSVILEFYKNDERKVACIQVMI